MPHHCLTSILFIITFQSFTFGQYIENTKVSKVDYASFKEAKLYVVLGLLHSGYDTEIKKAIKADWTFSEYEFIDTIAFRRLTHSGNDHFFLVPCQLDYFGSSGSYIVNENSTQPDGFSNTSRPDQHFIFLKIIKGNYQSFDYLRGDSRKFYPYGIASILYKLAYVPRKSGFGSKTSKSSRHQDALTIDSVPNINSLNLPLERPILSENKLISVLVRNLQLQCVNAVPGKTLKAKKRLKNINKSRSKIHTAPLYILESDLSTEVASLEAIKKRYSGEVHLVSKNEYVKILKEKRDVNIAHCFFNSYSNYFRIFNAKSGEQIYLKRMNNRVIGLREYHLNQLEAAKVRSVK